jgi:hypothetical protein
MRITGIRTPVVNAQMRNWVFAKVESDEAEARKHPSEQEVFQPMVFHADGSVAEW